MEENKVKEVKQEEHQQMKSKNNKTIIILSTIIVVLIIGVVLYFIFGNKNEISNNEKENNISESIVYKTSDESKTLKLIDVDDKNILEIVFNKYQEIFQKRCETNNSAVCEDIKNNKMTLYDYHKMITLNQPVYYAYYNDELIEIFEKRGNNPYNVFRGNAITGNIVNNYKYNILINLDTKTILNDKDDVRIISRMNTNYFALSDNEKYQIYTTDFTYLGDATSSNLQYLIDENGNVYVKKDNNIVAYNESGKEIAKYEIQGNIVSYIVSNTCYVLKEDNKKIYLMDLKNNNQVEIVTKKDNSLNNMYTSLEDNYIKIALVDDTEKYYYNSKTKVLSHSPKSVFYTSDDKKIELIEISNDKKNTGSDPHTYELYENSNKITVYSHYEKNKFVVSNDNNWYYLDKASKKIIAFYASKNKVSYSVNGNENDKQDWYIVYDVVGNKWNIVKVVNENNGSIITFTKNYPESYIINDEKVYLQFNNKIIKYDASGKTIDTKTYGKILYFDRGEYSHLVVIQDNKYYKVDLSNMKSELLPKEITYTDNNQNIDLYLWKEGTDEYNSSVYIFAYKDQYYTTDLHDFGKKDIEYDNIYFDRIDGPSQNYAGSFLVNTKTNKIISYSDFASMVIIKTNDGYFFIEQEFSESDNPYNTDVYIARKVITNKNNTIPGKGMCSVVENDIVIGNNNKLIKYSIDGTILNSMDIDNVILIELNNALVKINDKYYVINLKTYEKKQINLSSTIIEKNTTIIYSIDNEKIYYYDGDENKTYNY